MNPRSAGRSLRRAMAVLVAVGCAVTFASSASAGPTDNDKNGTPAGREADSAESVVPVEARLRQERLTAVAEQINASVDPHETGRPTVEGSEGYLFLRLSLEDDRLLLYWKGALPTSVRTTIAAHPDVVVEVRPATYTASAYMDAQDQLLAASRGLTGSDGARLVGIEHVGDLTGFKIIVFDPSRSMEESAFEEASPLIPQLGLSIEIAYVDEVVDTGVDASRQKD